SDDLRAALSDLEGNVAGAAGEIERGCAGGGGGERRHAALPAAVLPVREQDGDEIVAIGDGREEPADVAARSLRPGPRLAERRPAIGHSTIMVPRIIAAWGVHEYAASPAASGTRTSTTA